MSFPNAYEPHMPVGYTQYENLLAYTMFFLVLNKLVINGFGTGHEPQFFAARSERDCGKLACLWAILMTLRWPMMLACAVLGIVMVNQEVPDQSVLPRAANAHSRTCRHVAVALARGDSPTAAQSGDILADLDRGTS